MTTANWQVSQHAVWRAVERLDKTPEHARHELVQLMHNAKYVGFSEDGRSRVFVHIKSNTRLIVDKTEDRVITVYRVGTKRAASEAFAASTNNIIAKVRDTIMRELHRHDIEYKREIRSLTEQQALAQLEVAQHTLNQARARNPQTVRLLQTRIDEALDQFDRLGVLIDEKKAEYKRIKSEACEVLPL